MEACRLSIFCLGQPRFQDASAAAPRIVIDGEARDRGEHDARGIAVQLCKRIGGRS